MSVGFTVGFYWYQVGTGDFLHSFFSTIAYNLENKKWGSRFPIIMNEFYNGSISTIHIDEALDEINVITNELKTLSVDKLVWDYEDLSLLPPWGNKISDDITNLSNYFITSDGEDLITILFNALEMAKNMNMSIKITNI